MVNIVDFDEFLKSFGNRVSKLSMNMDIYDANFECACGNNHHMSNFLQIPLQGFQKVLVVCPNDDSYLTNVKIKTFMAVKFKGFESVCGAYLKTPEEKLMFNSVVSNLY